MTHYAGLDVSMNTTFICIVNEKGKVDPMTNKKKPH